LSPDAQRETIGTWAEREGVTVVTWHEDLAVSGGTEIDKRSGQLAGLAALHVHGAGVLVVAKRNRLARDVLTAAMVELLGTEPSVRSRDSLLRIRSAPSTPRRPICNKRARLRTQDAAISVSASFAPGGNTAVVLTRDGMS